MRSFARWDYRKCLSSGTMLFIALVASAASFAPLILSLGEAIGA